MTGSESYLNTELTLLAALSLEHVDEQGWTEPDFLYALPFIDIGSRGMTAFSINPRSQRSPR